MTAEELKYNPQRVNISIPVGKTIDSIIASFKETTPYFKNYITKFTHKVLNEEELTQEFVALLRRKTIDLPFLIGQEKADLYQNSGGRVDFYFYWKEETETTESFFDVEAKRLTDKFPKNRKKEYVSGDNKNGGIERFKIEKHGKGISQCGIVGFIEDYTADYWMKTINGWIIELSQTMTIWSEDEILIDPTNSDNYCYTISNAKRLNSEPVLLHHFWIVL